MEAFLAYLKNVIPRWLFLFLQPVYHFLMAFFAALFYGFPSRRLKVIGVTGTKGKTTVVELLHEILSEEARPVASFSSLRSKIGDKETKNERKMTMPGRFFMQRFLYQARKAGCKYAVLEVTSEGIKQFRHRFIKFDVAVMTNVAPEHIEAHGSFEKYLRAKLDLFWRLPKKGIALINRDDPQAERFAAATAARKIWYGLEGIVMDTRLLRFARNDSEYNEGISFEINSQNIISPLLGEFNLYNILAAVAVGLSQHIALGTIVARVSRVSGIPGRMEFVQREPFAVLVDYAHTPDSLKSVYKTCKDLKFKNLICVLGSAGGGRDKWKRPQMGRIAAEYCDEIILTNEDPYDEDPEEIMGMIEQGILQTPKFKNSKIQKLKDRREAIRTAFRTVRAGDVVILTGKGAEPWVMVQEGKRVPWDERVVVREELKNL